MSDTMTIPLTQGKVAIVSAEDYPELSKHKWCAVKKHNSFYAVRGTNMGTYTKQTYMHRQVLGNMPEGMFADHIDRDGLNNQRSNLRVATPKQNQGNTIQRSGTYKGVCEIRSRRGWRARIANKYLGTFKAAEDAAEAYNKAAIERWGDYARLNMIPSTAESVSK